MKLFKGLTLLGALLVTAGCSTSGNGGGGNGGNGGGGGSQTIFDKLIGTWTGTEHSPDTVFVFTKQNVTLTEGTSEDYNGAPVEILKLQDGREWALYHDEKQATIKSMIVFIDGDNLHFMTGNDKQYILDVPKADLDQVVAIAVAVKKK